MGFDSSGRHTGYYRYFFYRQVLHKEQSDACSLCFFQSAQSPIYVHLLAYLGLFHLAGGIYFPLFQWNGVPGWLSFLVDSRNYFFGAIFNLADAYISVAVVYLLIFQYKFFK